MFLLTHLSWKQIMERASGVSAELELFGRVSYDSSFGLMYDSDDGEGGDAAPTASREDRDWRADDAGGGGGRGGGTVRGEGRRKGRSKKIDSMPRESTLASAYAALSGAGTVEGGEAGGEAEEIVARSAARSSSSSRTGRGSAASSTQQRYSASSSSFTAACSTADGEGVTVLWEGA